MKWALINVKRPVFFIILSAFVAYFAAYIASSGSALAQSMSEDQGPYELGPVQANLYDTVIDCRNTRIHYDTFTRMFHILVDRVSADDVSLYGVATVNDDDSVDMQYRLGESVRASSRITELTEGFLVDTTVYLSDGNRIEGSTWVTDEMVGEYDCSVSDFGDTQSALIIIPIIIGGAACIGNQIACYNDVRQELDWCYEGCDNHQPGSQSCYDCCYGLAIDDHNNCFLTCGTNGPDDDYSNCYLGVGKVAPATP